MPEANNRLGHDEVMCGRYVVSKSTADLMAAFDVHESYVEELKPSYNVAPTDAVHSKWSSPYGRSWLP
jgi:hypothetical protein